MASPFDLRLSLPGGGDPRIIETNGVACSWLVADTGTLSAEVWTADLLAAGLAPDCRGREVRWEDAAIDAWGGIVTGVHHDLVTGTSEIGAGAWDVALDARIAPHVPPPEAATPMGLFSRIAAYAATSWAPLPVTFLIEEGGRMRPLPAGAGAVRDVLRRFADDADAEWRVTADKMIEIGPTVGVDRSAAVVAVWGIDVVEGGVDYDLGPVRNALRVGPGSASGIKRGTVEVKDDTSIAAVGLREDAIDIPGLATRPALRQAADALLARAITRGQTATVGLAARTDGGTILNAFREGDTIRLKLPPVGLDVGFRVFGRAWDTQTRVLTVTGDLR